MPLLDEISYVGKDEDRIRQYRAVRERQACDFRVMNFIRNEEKILWDAIEDFVKRSTINAASGVRGAFIFDLLTIDVHKELKTFRHSEFTSVIVNTASRMPAGSMKMIKYSSAYALLHKTLDVDWGKITFKTAVNVYKDKPEYLDLLVKLVLGDCVYRHDPLVVLLNDLSQNPVFDRENKLQQSRLKAVIDKLVSDSIEFIPEVYLQDKLGARELLSGSRL